MSTRAVVLLIGTVLVVLTAAAVLGAQAPGGTHPCDYQKASEAYAKEDLGTAEELYKSCLDAAPNDPKLHYLIGSISEKEGKFDDAIQHWTRAVALDGQYVEILDRRFDAKIQGIFREVIHDHFGQKFCSGVFILRPDRIVYRSLWGFPRLGTDDTFATPLRNIREVEVEVKERGKGWANNLPRRVELHFRFKEPIKGSKDSWSRDEMKFFFSTTELIQTELPSFGENLVKYLESKGVTIKEAK